MIGLRFTAGVIGMLVLAMPAAGAPASERKTSGQYHVLVGEIDDSDPSLKGEFSNAVTFKPRADERFIEVDVEDRSGLPTRALVVQEKKTSSGPRYVLEEEICDRSAHPIRINPGLNVKVLVQDGPCADGTNAAATTGTVKATFSR